VSGQRELRTHHDVAQVSGSIKLNDDYEGAALDFPRQRWDNTAMGVGSSFRRGTSGSSQSFPM
jgi:hypothetical protein